MIEKILRRFGYIKMPEYYDILHKLVEHNRTPYGASITPGEFFGFRRTFQFITGTKCPPYTKIG